MKDYADMPERSKYQQDLVDHARVNPEIQLQCDKCFTLWTATEDAIGKVCGNMAPDSNTCLGTLRKPEHFPDLYAGTPVDLHKEIEDIIFFRYGGDASGAATEIIDKLCTLGLGVLGETLVELGWIEEEEE